MAISHGTWKPIDRIGLNQAIDVNSTTQKHTIGQRVRCRDVGSTGYGEGEFIYLVGVASTAKGDAVTYNLVDGVTTRLVTNGKGPMAVAMAATVANEYGWYQIQGEGVVAAGSSAAAGTPVYATGTAGTVDNSQADSQQVINAFFCADDDTGFAKITLQYPVAGTDDQLS
jgi:hypothetical protein